MGVFDARRAQLAIGEQNQAQSDSPAQESNVVSPFQVRKMDLGLIPDTRVSPVPYGPPAPAKYQLQNLLPPVDVNRSPLMQKIQQVQPVDLPSVSESNAINDLANKLGSRPKLGTTQAPILQLPNYVLTKAQENALPDSYLGGATDAQGFTSPRAAFAANNQVDTGSPELNKVGDYIGNLGAAFVPIGGGSPVINDASNAIGKLAATELGQKVEQGIGNIGSRAANALNPLLNTQGINLSPDLAAKALQATVKGAATGALYGATTPFTYGNGDLSKVPGSVAENALGFAGAEGAVPVLSAGTKALVDKYAGTSIGDALSNFFTRHNSVTPQQEQAFQNLMQRTENPQNISGTLRPATQEQYINKVMSDIAPEVNQRMTLPLENPNELAKFVQQHWGEPISLNEVRKLPYNDLMDIAQQMKKEMKLPEVAAQVAREKGYDLNKILDNELPNIQDRVKTDASKRAYGIYPETLPPVSRMKPETAALEAAPKQSFYSRLFGEQNNVGITPFGSKNGGKIVTTEQQIVKNPLRNNVQGAANATKQALRGAYHQTVDYLSPLKKINREVYNSAMDSARANNLADTIIRDKFVDNQGNVVGHSLNDIMEQARGLGKKLDDYLILRHAETRLQRGERVYDENLNMTPEKAAEMTATLEKRYPQLKQIGKMWDEFNTNMLDSGVQEGLISQRARDVMREENPHYASMKRQFTVGEKMAQPKWSGGNAFSGQAAPIKKVSPTGSTRKIVSPIRSAIEQAYAWKNAELRNRTMQQIVKAIQQNPEDMKGIAEIVKKPTTSYKNLDEVLREGGSEEFLKQLDGDFKSLFQKAKSGEDNIVRAMVGGHPVFVKVHDPEAVKALLGIGSEQSGIILDALQKMSNAVKRGATGVLAPLFSVKNLTADTIQAFIQSPNALQHAVDLPVAVISSIADALHIPGLNRLAEDFRRSGGEYSALLRGDRSVNNSVYSLRREAPLSPQGIVKGAYHAVKFPFKALEKVADITENANRMAAYRREMMGKPRTPENVRNAMNAARESTVNFSRKGASSRSTEAFIPYSNAAIQGMYRITKAFAQHPVKTLAGLTTLVIGPKLYEYAQFNNDPDYQKLPARERYRNIIYGKNADGTFKKLPMPPEYEAFGAFMTDVLNDVINNDPQAYKGTLDALANAWSPPAVSGSLQGVTQGGGVEQSIKGMLNATTIAPFVAVAGNQSFTGAPIVPQRLQNNSTPYQYDEKTSNAAKWIGKQIGLAPLKVDYLIRAYGGDPSRLLLPLTSPVGSGNMRNTLLKNFIVDPVFTNTLSNDYYYAKDAYTKAEGDAKDFGAPLPAWYDQNMAKIVNSQAKNSYNKQLSELSNQKRSVQVDSSLTNQQKTAKIRDLQSQINQIYLDANSKLEQSGFKFQNR